MMRKKLLSLICVLGLVFSVVATSALTVHAEYAEAVTEEVDVTRP